MRRRGVGFALGAAVVVTAAGLLAAQAPARRRSSPRPSRRRPHRPRRRRPRRAAAAQPPAQTPPAPAAEPAAASQAAAAAVVPRRRRRRVAERHRRRSVAQLRDLARAGRLRRLRGRREAGRHLLQQGAAAGGAVAAPRHQRQHGRQAAADPGSGDRLRQADEAGRHGAGHRLRQPGVDPAAVHLRSARPSRRPSARRCRTARRRSTTRCTSRSRSCSKVRATSSGDVRRQAIVVLSDGEDTSSLVPFEEVLDLAKRSEVIVYTIGIRGRDFGARGFPEARVRAQAVRAGNGRPRLLPDRRDRAGGDLRADRRRAGGAVRPGLFVAQSAARRPVAAHRGPHDASPTLAARTKQGYFGPVN